jgi:hypothetical protein
LHVEADALQDAMQLEIQHGAVGPKGRSAVWASARGVSRTSCSGEALVRAHLTRRPDEGESYPLVSYSSPPRVLTQPAPARASS